MDTAKKSGSTPYMGTDPRMEIVEYLHAHPSAADTVDGVIQWWLPLQRYETARDVIQKALDDLVEEGIIEYVKTGDDRRVFRLTTQGNGNGTS